MISREHWIRGASIRSSIFIRVGLAFTTLLISIKYK